MGAGRQAVVELALLRRELSYDGLDVSPDDLEGWFLSTFLGFAAKIQRSILLEYILCTPLHECFKEDLQSTHGKVSTTILHRSGD